MLRIGIEPEQLRNNSRLDKSLRGEDDQTGSILYVNDVFALYIGGAILEEMRKPDSEWRMSLLHHLAEALTVHFVTQYGVYTVSEYTGEITDADLDGIRNVCRCGTYPRIRQAIQQGAAKM